MPDTDLDRAFDTLVLGIERVVVPHDRRRFERRRISRKALEPTGLAAPHASQAGARHVPAGFERVACPAGAREHLGSA